MRMSAVRVLDGSVWRGFGRADITAPGSSSDGFIDDVTMPRWLGTNNPNNNVGCKYNVPRTTVATLPGAQAPGKVWENLTITGQVTINQPGQKFINCRGTFSYTGNSGGGMFYLMASALSGGASANVARTEFHFCEVEPSTPGDRYNGVYGHDFYFYRSVITKSVDCFGLYNSNNPYLNVEVACSWLGNLAWFNDDRPSVGNGHDNGTHNDTFQNGACRRTKVHGCFLQGAKFNVLNPNNIKLDADNMEFTYSVGNGTTVLDGSADNRWPQQGQCYLGKADAYYPVNEIDFHHNWLWNFDNGFKLISRSTGLGAFYIDDVSVHDNVFGGVWRNWGGSQRYYPIRYDTNCTVNGRRATSDQTTVVDVWNNVWDINANPGVNYGDGTPVAGSPVRHRIDVVAVP